MKYASNREFTDVMVFNEDRKHINGMLLIHLPDGPTAHFKLSNLVLSKDIKVRLLPASQSFMLWLETPGPYNQTATHNHESALVKNPVNTALVRHAVSISDYCSLQRQNNCGCLIRSSNQGCFACGRLIEIA